MNKNVWMVRKMAELMYDTYSCSITLWNIYRGHFIHIPAPERFGAQIWLYIILAFLKYNTEGPMRFFQIDRFPEGI